jgi:putative phage-type endonuclease
VDRNKIIWTEEELEQGSPEWFEWRKGSGSDVEMTLGGSEVAPLLYMSPWATPLEVFKWKLGIEEKEFSEEQMKVMEEGTRKEPIARAHYEKTFGTNIRTLCAVHPDLPWMRTSLDGITDDNRVILEIKNPGSHDKHVKQTKSGKVPSYRWPQLQWQIGVMQAVNQEMGWPDIERVDYVSFWIDEEEDGAVTFTDMHVIPVYPNWEAIHTLMDRAERLINNHLKTKVPPPPTIFLENTPLIAVHPKPRIDGYWTPDMIPAI